VTTSHRDLPIKLVTSDARLIVLPEASVFDLRAAGLAAARGRIVLVTEDHAIVPHGWAAGMLAALAANPDAALAAPVITNAAVQNIVDRGSFLLWFSPFGANVPAGDRRRSPPASNVGVRVSEITPGPTRPGTFEVVDVPNIWRAGKVVAVPDVVIQHSQSLGAFTFVHAFHNGRASRAFEQAPLGWSARVKELRALPGHLRDLLATVQTHTRTDPVLHRQARQAWPVITALALCHTAGVGVAMLSGSGRSPYAVR
jgi:hypothetical protein